MKKVVLLIIGIAICYGTFGQSVSLKKDTIMVNRKPYALFKKTHEQPLKYIVYALGGLDLLEIHAGRVEIKGRPGYVVTFLNNSKQAMITKDSHFPISFFREMVKYDLVKNGASINETRALQFIKAHPMPDGYTDVEQIINY